MQNNFSTTKWMLMLEASICVCVLVCVYVSVTIISHSNPTRPLTSFLAQTPPRYPVVTYCVIDLEDHSRPCMFIKEHGIPNIANWTKILSLLWRTKMSFLGMGGCYINARAYKVKFDFWGYQMPLEFETVFQLLQSVLQSITFMVVNWYMWFNMGSKTW